MTEGNSVPSRQSCFVQVLAQGKRIMTANRNVLMHDHTAGISDDNLANLIADCYRRYPTNPQPTLDTARRPHVSVLVKALIGVFRHRSKAV
jgi:hypothetical protein